MPVRSTTRRAFVTRHNIAILSGRDCLCYVTRLVCIRSNDSAHSSKRSQLSIDDGTLVRAKIEEDQSQYCDN